MSAPAPDISAIQAGVLAWAAAQAPIRTVILVGSRARRDRPGDQWADLDLLLYTTGFAPYLVDTGWLAGIAPVWVCLPHQTGAGDPQQLVLFAGGHKVDFAWYARDRLAAMTTVAALPDEFRRGYQVLLDKDGLATSLPPCPFAPAPVPRPDATAFATVVHTFWYGAVYVAKQIRRRQLWLVKFRDWTMKEQLLAMLEWHALARHGWELDVWHDGKFLPQWVDPATRTALDEVFGRFDAADSWRALRRSMALFRRLATDTAAYLGFSYPALLDQEVTGLVTALMQADDGLAA